jgi:peptidoglycan hydrolase-like protein with peptidoglycan-binding domain
MARSARPVDRRPPVQEEAPSAAATLGAMIMRNPAAVGGSTAFLVALFYVSANALWYQPHAHLGAFFATRDFVRGTSGEAAVGEPETTFVIERPVVKRPPSDPTTQQVQRILRDLQFYAGEVDGVAGPATLRAIQAYQQKIGLEVTGKIDDVLLEQLGAQPTTSGIAPIPVPRPAAAVQPPAAPSEDATALNMKIQAGLKAFGNEDVGIDGVIGSRTRAAIREFQSLFGMPVTGEPDEALYAKMREIGLTN